MASELLRVVLELVTGQYKQEARRAAASTKEIADSADKAGASTGALPGRFQRVGAAAQVFLGTAAAGAVGAFIRSAIDDASSLEQAVGGTEAVFKDLSGAITEVAETSADAMGLSEREFREATTAIGGTLKRMTGDLGFAADQSVRLTEVAADLAATYGGTTQEAIEALGSAFRGEADPAERFNLNLKIGQVNAKALELGLAKSTSEVDDHARAQATIALIMEQSADAQGQFARESETAAGQQQRLRAEMENMSAEIGEQLLPVWVEMTESFRNALPVITDVIDLFASTESASDEARDSVSIWARAIQAIVDPVGAATRAAEDMGAAVEESAERGSHASVVWGEHEDAVRKGITGYNDAIPKLEAADQALLNMSERTAASSVLKAVGDEAANAAPSLQDMADAVHAVRTAMQEAADPAFAAVEATKRLMEAEQARQEVLEDEDSTVQDVAAAHLDVAEARLEAEAALAAFGAAGKEKAIRAIAEALDASYAAAEDLLITWGLLDEQGELNLDANVNMSAADRALLATVQAMTNTRGQVNIDTVLDPGVQVRQHGGPVTAGRPYLVGEAGPELIIPTSSGFVVNNADVQAMLAAISQGSRGGDFIANFQHQDPRTDAQLVGALRAVQRRMETL